MFDEQIERLRRLRRTATSLGSTASADLAPFISENKLTFRRLPDKDDLDVATTCTVLMALAGTNQLEGVYKPIHGDRNTRDVLRDAFSKTFDAEWTSSGLDTPNPFTGALIIRTSGHLKAPIDAPLAERRYSGVWRKLSLNRPSLAKIFRTLTKDCKANLELDKSLRANPALGYWLLDGADLLKLEFQEGDLNGLATWASDEFRMHVSLVAAQDDVSMDPVAMAMAACITERLRRITNRNLNTVSDDMVRSQLPSLPESVHGIQLLFQVQGKSGIWDKYFPMFYYRKEGKPGGANYCFAFELLEAVLHEFDTVLLRDERILSGLELACRWCEENRLVYPFQGKPYCGWNSGQQIITLQKGQPESWATATVHMFLLRLIEVCSAEIQRLILQKYRAEYIRPDVIKGSKWTGFIDSDVELRTGKESTVRTLIHDYIVQFAPPLDDYASILHPKDRPRQNVDLKERRSALLFGPPGTSKSTIARAIAEKLDWPFVEITPSHFLRKGLEQIYVEANNIFDDLLDLSGVIILFDEMDALVQRRSGAAVEQLDVTRQFLTTSMLPKLQKLHDGRRVIFLMATNHRQQFDDAIIRPGRFDLLVCVGPPSWTRKQESPDVWVRPPLDGVSTTAVSDKIKVAVSGTNAEKALNLFTIDEMKELVEHFRAEYRGLNRFISEAPSKECQLTISDWGERLITLREGSEARLEYEQQDRRASRIQA